MAQLYFNGFESDTTDAEPADITKYGTNNTYMTRADSSLQGSKLLDVYSTATSVWAHNWFRFNTEPSTGDYEVRGLVNLYTNGALRVGLIFRAVTGTCYMICLKSGNEFRLSKLTTGTPPTEQTISSVTGLTISANTKYWIKVKAEGSAIKANFWVDGQSEPTDWRIEVTDTTHNNTKKGVGFYCYTGQATGTEHNYFDSLTVNDLSTTVTQAVTVDAKVSIKKLGVPRTVDAKAAIYSSTTQEEKTVQAHAAIYKDNTDLYFNGFESDTPDATPSGISRYGTNGIFTVLTNSAMEGSKLCRHNVTTIGTFFHDWFRFTTEPSVGDYEVKGIVRFVENELNRAGIIFRATGNTAYSVNLRYDGVNETLRLSKFIDAAETQIVTTNVSALTVNTRYWIKVRVEGSSIKATYWEYGTSEPSTWIIDTTDTTHNNTKKGVGFHIYNGQVVTSPQTYSNIYLDSLTVTALANYSTLTKSIQAKVSVKKMQERPIQAHVRVYVESETGDPLSFNGFEDDTIGGEPAGIVKVSTYPTPLNTYEVMSGTDMEGVKYLKVTNPTDLSWGHEWFRFVDEPTDTNYELKGLFNYAVNNGNRMGLVFRSSGSIGYLVALRYDEGTLLHTLRLSALNGINESPIQTIPLGVLLTPATKYWIKVLVDGNVYKATYWADGSAEPTTWIIDTVDNTIATTNKAVGVYNYIGQLAEPAVLAEQFVDSIEVTGLTTTGTQEKTVSAHVRIGGEIRLRTMFGESRGMNYYHESMGYIQRNDAQILNDLTRIAVYTKMLKIYHNPYTNAGGVSATTSMNLCKKITTYAKQMGFYVIWTLNYDNSTKITTEAQWTDYRNKVFGVAQEAQSYGANEIHVANEPSLHMTYADLPAKLATLAGDCQAYFNSTIGVEIGWFERASYPPPISDNFQTFYVTLYENLYEFIDIMDDLFADYGGKLRIGEFGPACYNRSQTQVDENQWCRFLLRKMDYCRRRPIPYIFPFTWKEPDDDWGYVNHTTDAFFDAYNYLSGWKELGYTQEFLDNFKTLSNTGHFSGGTLATRFQDINNNTIQMLDVGSAETVLTTNNINTQNFVFRGYWRLGDVPAGTYSVRFIGRYIDASNYYYMEILPNTDQVKFFRRQGGTNTQLGSTLSADINQYHVNARYEFELRIAGTGSSNSVLALFNNKKVYQGTDTGNTALNSGKVGFAGNGIPLSIVEAQVHTQEIVYGAGSYISGHVSVVNTGSSTQTYTVDAKVSIKRNEIKTVSAYTSVAIQGSKTIQAKVSIKKAFSQIIEANTSIKRAGTTKTIMANVSVNTGINPYEYLFPNRKVRIRYGFGSDFINTFSGRSDFPEVDVKNQEAKFHFFDELDFLAEYRLPGGSLLTNIRTDRYIWRILDEVYQDFFTILGSCDIAETWTNSTDESVNHRGGDACQKIESTGTTVKAYKASPPSLTVDNTHISFFVYVSNFADTEVLKIRLENTADTNYVDYDLVANGLIAGWNEFHIPVADFVEHGTADPTDTLARLTFEFKVATATTGYVLVDEVRATEAKGYPRRYFDTGIQTILVAWYAGNTALYEIKTACEAEGARFYCDENHELRFENRQHYNLNAEHKSAVWSFTYNNMTDLDYVGRIQEVINKVIVSLRPRKLVDEKEIWRYGFTPEILASATRTIWAEFPDPCPTTASGIVTPVSTTDYTANTLEDGTGTDKTAQVSIVITKFATAAKIEVTNNDANPVYLTMLKVRGTPAEQSDESQVIVQDDTSITNYGLSPSGGLVIENKYLADENYAETIAQQLIDWYKSPVRRIVLKGRTVPQIQLGDMIVVRNEDLAENYLMRITKIKTSYSPDTGFNQEIHTRAVTNFETLDYFTIGTSEIGGTDVIAP